MNDYTKAAIARQHYSDLEKFHKAINKMNKLQAKMTEQYNLAIETLNSMEVLSKDLGFEPHEQFEVTYPVLNYGGYTTNSFNEMKNTLSEATGVKGYEGHFEDKQAAWRWQGEDVK